MPLSQQRVIVISIVVICTFIHPVFSFFCFIIRWKTDNMYSNHVENLISSSSCIHTKICTRTLDSTWMKIKSKWKWCKQSHQDKKNYWRHWKHLTWFHSLEKISLLLVRLHWPKSMRRYNYIWTMKKINFNCATRFWITQPAWIIRKQCYYYLLSLYLYTSSSLWLLSGI